MALSSCSRRLLCFATSNCKARCVNYRTQSFHIFSNALRDHGIGDADYSLFSKTGFPMMGSRGMCTSMLRSESSEGSFPSDLLSRKKIITEERAIGQLQDLVIPVTNFHNEDKGLMVLAGDVFDVPIRKDIIHRVVRWQLAKRQQGTHSTKTISEVSGTGRKPWRQKAEGKLLVFDDLELPTHKTKNIVSYVSQMEDTKKLLVVDGGPIDDNLKLATQNLHYVNVLPSIGLNVYSILLHDTLVMSRDAVNKIVERMHTPIKR
nr:ribosomal protein L4/L1 family isoform 1 [Tanacetum cinerariifolium]